ncbi:pyridoxal-phosphate dependent enzyme [Acidiplasma sp.]|uniref:pyridoxal-phosphate dependent enzyme n=1 Tax=Acidiplasma sp. TaxID=1872114 RepID=UPI002587EDE2|nr:pyridoxal-phosphate dependent enzyme [Acidiplasma sp.]
MSIENDIASEMYSFGIGNTPLIKLDDNLYAKAEFCNKFGSIKSRAAFFMIDYALKTGIINRDTIIVEASSGNTGIAVAGISNLFGLKSKIIIPEGASNGTKDYLKSLGSDLILTKGNSTEASIEYARSIVESDPGRYFRLNQHGNNLNSDAHYYTTAPEIKNEIINVDFLVAGIGTGGTITGISRYLKENGNTKTVGIIPDSGSHIFGLRNPFISNNKGILDKYMKYIDDVKELNEKYAYYGVRELMDKQRLFCRPLIGC